MQSQKREKVLEGIRNSIDLFLTENADKFGFCHVEEIDIADDLKSAKVFVSFIDDKNTKKRVELLNKSHRAILNEYNKHYSSRYFPSLKFYSFNDEFNI